MIRRPPRSTPLYSSAASDVYKRQVLCNPYPKHGYHGHPLLKLTGAYLPAPSVTDKSISPNSAEDVGCVFLVLENEPQLAARQLSHYRQSGCGRARHGYAPPTLLTSQPHPVAHPRYHLQDLYLDSTEMHSSHHVTKKSASRPPHTVSVCQCGCRTLSLIHI